MNKTTSKHSTEPKSPKKDDRTALFVALGICVSLVVVLAGLAIFGGIDFSGDKKEERVIPLKDDIKIDEDKKDLSEHYDSYSEQQNDEKFVKTISAEKLNKKLEDKTFTGILYIGRHTCPACKSFRPKLNSAIIQTGENVYYMNTEISKKDFPKEHANIMDKLNIEFVPSMRLIKKGEVIESPDMTSWQKSQIVDWIKEKSAKIED